MHPADIAHDVDSAGGGLFNFDDLDVKEVDNPILKESSKEFRSEAEQHKQTPITVLASEILNQLELELERACQQPMVGSRLTNLSSNVPCVAAESSSSAGDSNNGAGEPFMIVNMHEGRRLGGAGLLDAASIDNWLGRARQWLQLLNPRAQVPLSSRLPASAVHWEPAAAILFVLTHGQFDPQRDILDASVGVTLGLISVVCATSDRHRSFHPLLYANFCTQTYEPRELVVVHTGEMPSEFFRERARDDVRVVYRFFPVTQEAPGSPRLTDEKVGNPLAAVLCDDDPEEIIYWSEGDPWAQQIDREGWTKGLKRNIACCIAKGTVIAHFDDGCLYAPNYLSCMYEEFVKEVQRMTLGNSARAPTDPVVATLAQWHTVAIADQDFRWVDLMKLEPLWDQLGGWERSEELQDRYNYGFTYMYNRSTWEHHPFPDIETVGTEDRGFMSALRRAGVPVKLVQRPRPADTIAACGWHRDSMCGSKSSKRNVSHSQVLYGFQYRGEWVYAPEIFKQLLPLVAEVASKLLARRERYLKDLVEDHGSVYVCAWCNFAVAQHKNMKHDVNQMKVSRWLDSHKVEMKFEVGEFSCAGGAVAEGDVKQSRDCPNSWLKGRAWRNAQCRNCGVFIGFRYEPGGGTKPAGPLAWGLIWRYLRERRKPGEHVPKEWHEWDLPRHSETAHNRSKNNVCPQGHRLGCYCPVHYFQKGGGAYADACGYVCDICDRPAATGQHLWGCGTCDYDMCERCKAKRA